MFELIKQVWIENVAKLANRVVYFARGSTCTRKILTGSVNVEDLVKDHEETDTKLHLLKPSGKNNDDRNIVRKVRLSSGSIDIPIIFWVLNWKETSTFTSITAQVKIEKFWT